MVKSCVDTLENSKMWNTSDLGIVKANWDASICLRANVIGLRCVIRNDEGLVVGTKCCVCKVEANPLLAEVMAAVLAIAFCKEMVLTNIVCEGDSLQVIQAIHNPRSSHA